MALRATSLGFGGVQAVSTGKAKDMGSLRTVNAELYAPPPEIIPAENADNLVTREYIYEEAEEVGPELKAKNPFIVKVPTLKMKSNYKIAAPKLKAPGKMTYKIKLPAMNMKMPTIKVK